MEKNIMINQIKNYLMHGFAILLLLLIGIIVLCSGNSFADEEQTPSYDKGFLLDKISIEFDLSKDSSKDLSVKVTNLYYRDVSLKAEARAFTAVGKDYKTTFGEKASYSQMADWVKFKEKTFTIPSRGTYESHFTVTKPKNFAGTKQYCYVFFTDGADKNKTGGATLGVAQEVGVLLKAKTQDGGKYEGKIIDKDLGKPFYFKANPFEPYVTYENTGTLDFGVTVSMKVKNKISGKKIVETKEGDDKNLYISNAVLPGTERKEQITFEGMPTLGLYDVTLKTTAKELDLEKTFKKTILIIPLWLCILIILILLAIIANIVFKITKKEKIPAKKKTMRRGFFTR
jgi:hypothetical protein